MSKNNPICLVTILSTATSEVGGGGLLVVAAPVFVATVPFLIAGAVIGSLFLDD